MEAWARSADNPVGGWYGLRKGYRGRFGNYVPPVLEVLGLAEVEHTPRNNRMRALSCRTSGSNWVGTLHAVVSVEPRECVTPL